MKSICVYCGASPGASPLYAAMARSLATALVKDDIALVYGGGRVGLMGILADEVLRLGGNVTGVIPQALMDKETGHTGLSRLHVVKDMHERKAMMADLADGFIALPGGIGTLEELFEVLTWAQLGLHTKPIGLFNGNGFYDGLLAFIKHLVTEQFVKIGHASLLLEDNDAKRLVNRLKNFQPPAEIASLDQAIASTILP